MNNRRKLIIALGAGALAGPFRSFAQQPGKVWRLGFLGVTSASVVGSRIAALRAGLRDLGYVEGKNIVLEFRWAEENYAHLPRLAAELVGLHPDVIVTQATSGTRAARQATTTIPIVMATSGDAVATGLISSLSRPGGNITGSTFFLPELAAKRLESLREIFPQMERVAALLGGDDPMTAPVLKNMERAAGMLKFKLQRLQVHGPGELDIALAAMIKARAEAVVVTESPALSSKAIAEFSTRMRVPSVGASSIAEAGGLIGYGPNFLELYRRAAYFVDKIFKGAQPKDIPVEQPTKFEMVINMKTAKALGIKIPQSILVRADKVIE